MQSSHLTAMAMPSAINSFVLPSSALAAVAAWAIPENAFITSGAPPRKFLSCAVSSLVICGQSFMIYLRHQRHGFLEPGCDRPYEITQVNEPFQTLSFTPAGLGAPCAEPSGDPARERVPENVVVRTVRRATTAPCVVQPKRAASVEAPDNLRPAGGVPRLMLEPG